MADTKTSTPRRPKAPADPEALAFGVITTALEGLNPEAVHRTLDHVAKRHGFYVVTDLPELVGNGQRGEQMTPGPVERTYDPPVGADPHAG